MEKITKNELIENRKRLKESCNLYIDYKLLKNRLEKIEKSCKYFLVLEKKDDKLLKYELKWIEKTTKKCKCIQNFFDEHDMLTYLKGLENGINPSNFKK